MPGTALVFAFRIFRDGNARDLWAQLERTVANVGKRDRVGVVSRGEDLIGGLEIMIRKRRLDDRGAGLAQQANDPLAGDAVGEVSIGGWREYHAIFCHENV
jgi:hypothetical protein